LRVMVIGAHADDSEISTGGTIAKFTQSGSEVKIITAIIPHEDIDGIPSKETKKRRWEECENSARVLGAEVEILDLDPYQMWFKRDVVKLLDQKILEFSPDIVFTHWDHDSHQDHVAIANATFAATRRNNISLLMCEQLTLGGITPYSFTGNTFVDISDTMEAKLESVKAYKSQAQRYKGWLKAIEGLAAFRGHQIGVKYAEAFESVRILFDIKKNSCTICGLWP